MVSIFDKERKKRPVVPVRFVQACVNGHISDVDWYDFVHRGQSACKRQLWMDERGTALTTAIRSITSWVIAPPIAGKNPPTTLGQHFGGHRVGACDCECAGGADAAIFHASGG
jgi:hypothetical protein